MSTSAFGVEHISKSEEYRRTMAGFEPSLRKAKLKSKGHPNANYEDKVKTGTLPKRAKVALKGSLNNSGRNRNVASGDRKISYKGKKFVSESQAQDHQDAVTQAYYKAKKANKRKAKGKDYSSAKEQADLSSASAKYITNDPKYKNPRTRSSRQSMGDGMAIGMLI